MNPSGRTVDTYEVDAMNSPAAQNFGDFAYYDENGNLTKYNYVSYKEGIYVGYRYYETRYEDKVLGQGNAGDYNYDDAVMYPFGYGLSYTKFGFKNAAVSANEAGSDGLDVTVDVTNEGSVAGRESVEVYVKAERENTPNAQLKGLAKVELQPGETKQVKIHLPLAAFALCNEEGTPIVEAGNYSVYVGASQPDARSVALMGQAPAKLTVTQSATQALDL